MPEGQQIGATRPDDESAGTNLANMAAESAIRGEVARMAHGTRKLSVGRIVHYTNLGDADGKFPPETQPALVVRVNADGTTGLWVFYPGGFFYMDAVQEAVVAAPLPQRGRWNWPLIG